MTCNVLSLSFCNLCSKKDQEFYLTLSDLGYLKHSMPGGGADSTPFLSLLLLEKWQPNLTKVFH